MRLAYGIRHVRGISMQRQDQLHADTGGIGYRCGSRAPPALGDVMERLAILHQL